MPTALVVPVITTFTQADGALASGWTASPFNSSAPMPGVLSNQWCVPAATFSYCDAWWTAAQFGPAVQVGFDIATISADPAFEIYVSLRVQQPSASSNTGDGYVIEYVSNGTAINFYRSDNASQTLIGNTSGLTKPSSGDGLRFDMVGNQMQAYRRVSGVWAPYGTPLSDPASTYMGAGFISLGGYEDARSMRLDNLAAGTIPSTGAGMGSTARALHRRRRR